MFSSDADDAEEHFNNSDTYPDYIPPNNDQRSSETESQVSVAQHYFKHNGIFVLLLLRLY